MKQQISILALLMSLCLLVQSIPMAVAAPAVTSMILAQNGKSAYVITLAEDAIPAEKTAAVQLQKYLTRITGATLVIKNEGSTPDSQPQIFVGNSFKIKTLAPSVNWNDLGQEGIVVKTVGSHLVLSGGRPRGSLYAVFEFLETVGCRWWAPGEVSIPRNKTLKVAPQNTVFVPPFAYREHFTTAYNTDPEFSTVQRINGLYQTQNKAWGDHYRILGGGHTFGELIPPSKYFKKHPEWFSDPLNGDVPCTAASKMPEKQGAQLCLSNKAAQAELLKNALKWLDKNPTHEYISISINDNKHFCRCPDCLKLYEQEGSWSGPLLKFVNEIAAVIHEKHPGVIVETLTYIGTDVPPRTIRPASNVLVRLAPLEADFGHPLNSDWNAKTRENLQAWSKISSQFFVWNYTTNFYYTSLPHPNWRFLADDLRFFAENRVTGVFEQGDDYTKGAGDFVQLRTWLIAKLLWNPNLDQSALTDEFLAGYYGAAGPYLRQYLDLVQDAFDAKQRPLSTYNEDFSFLDLKTMNAATRMFQQAAVAVKDNEELSTRVRREKLSLDLVWLQQYKWLLGTAQRGNIEFLGPKDAHQAAEAYILAAHEFDLKNYGEQRAFVLLEKNLKNIFLPATPLPEFAQKFPSADVIDIQELAFTLYKVGESTKIVDDASASNGKAVWILGSDTGWLTQVNTRPYRGLLQDGKWRCYAMVKVEAKKEEKPEGYVMQFGVYDVATNTTADTGYRSREELQLERYSPLDLGVMQMGLNKVLWVAAVNNPKVASLSIDRLILVREP